MVMKKTYKIDVDCANCANKMEEAANKMEKEGFELVSCSIMPSSKGILVFKKPGEPANGK